MSEANQEGFSELHCMAPGCGGLIPARRATQKDVKTCSTECAKNLRRYNAQSGRNMRCPACLRPSSEVEREEFRQWRRTKGPLQAFLPTYRGNGSSHAHTTKLRKALAGVLEWLKKDLAEVLDTNGLKVIDGQLSGEDSEPISPELLLGAALAQEMLDRIAGIETMLATNLVGRQKKPVDTPAAE